MSYTTRWTSRFLGIITLVLFSTVLVVNAGDEKTEDPPPPSAKALESLQRLKWMQGEWVTQRGKDTLEETWSAPERDSLMGMFRWIKADGVWMFELMTITATGDDVVFRLKHFGHDMKGWEEKDESVTAQLISQTDTEAVFEGPGGRFAFSTENDELTVRVGKNLVVPYKRK